jgi:hypothetical protein
MRSLMLLHSAEIMMIVLLALVMCLGRFAEWSNRTAGLLIRTRQPRLMYLPAVLGYLLLGAVESHRVVSQFKEAIRFEPQPGERICPRCGQLMRPVQVLTGSHACSACGYHLPE